MLIDFIAVAFISIAICILSQELLLMSIFVPLIILLRFVCLTIYLPKSEVNIKQEFVFFIICTLLGAFNDWNSVCSKEIYNYTVPYYVNFSSIPLWMLLYWGLILRTVSGFSHWEYLKPPLYITNKVGIGKYDINHAYFRIVTYLTLVFVSRQFIYSFYLHPIYSWLPFLIVFIIWLAFFRITSHDIYLILIFLIAGPLIEILYIKIGGLHYYHLGWIGGVPVWIAIWWAIIILIWKDLSARILYNLKKIIK